jgi:3-oxoacyl-[acyl-carrier-protein] synthase-3
MPQPATPTEEERRAARALSPLGPDFGRGAGPVTEYLAEELALVWAEFTKKLDATPIVSRVTDGTVTVEDYKELLLNLRQQVMEGGRWIALAASSMSIELFPVRSLLIRHSAEEHMDYQMIERDYCSLGGTLEEMNAQPKNIGSEAFNAFMFFQAAKPDPLDLFGAMFIIEGLGSSRAAGWAKEIRGTLNLSEEQVSFLAYHGENDEGHYDKLRMILGHPLIDMELAKRLVRTAKIVGRLYVLQLEELGNV